MESTSHLFVSSQVSGASHKKQFTAVIERDCDTGLYFGWVPGFTGAHSQGVTLDELRANLQ